MTFLLLSNYGGEAGIRTAYEANGEQLRPIIETEIEYHMPMCDRDHATRQYVSMLRRIVGLEGADLAMQHETKMKAALEAIKPKDG